MAANLGKTFRVNNSGGKTLLENWVEEGILTTTFDSPVENLSTTKDSYRQPPSLGTRLKGKKLELLERELVQKLSSEVRQGLHPPPSPSDYRSVTKKDFFSKEFVPQERVPELPHDVNKEQPLTFWSENFGVVHGVSQVKTRDTPFRKNAAFSTPVEDYKDAPKPNEEWKFDGV